MFNIKVRILFLIIFFFNFQTQAEKSIQFYTGSDFMSYNLKSDSFSASQPLKSGNFLTLSFENRALSDHSKSRFSFNQATHSLSPDATLFPRSVQTTLTNLRVAHLRELALISSLEVFQIGVGYSFYNLKTGATTPNILMVDSELHVLDLLVEYDFFEKNDYVVKGIFEFGLPFLKKDYGVFTGYNHFTYIFSVGYDVKKLINEKWSLLHKAEYFSQKNEFSGTGNRGTINAQENWQHYKFLIGAGYDF